MFELLTFDFNCIYFLFYIYKTTSPSGNITRGNKLLITLYFPFNVTYIRINYVFGVNLCQCNDVIIFVIYQI